MTGEKLDEGLICQLYATIPLGSLTADHESVKGTVTDAPDVGAVGIGAAGPAGGGVGVGVGVEPPLARALLGVPRTSAISRVESARTTRNLSFIDILTSSIFVSQIGFRTTFLGRQGVSYDSDKNERE